MADKTNTTQSDRNMNDENKIPIFAHITVCAKTDYMVKDLVIDEVYDRVIIVANGNEILAYMPLISDCLDDLKIVERLMQQIIHTRKTINR